jgi:Ca2+-binding EF-hand superfamily protein
VAVGRTQTTANATPPPLAGRLATTAVMEPRWCKKCKSVFESDTCPAGHAVFMYTKKIPAEAQAAPEPEAQPAPELEQPEPQHEPEPEPEPEPGQRPSAQLQKEVVEAVKAASAADKKHKGAAADERRRLASEALSHYERALALHAQLEQRDDVKAVVKATLADKMGKATVRCDKLRLVVAEGAAGGEASGLPSTAGSSADSEAAATSAPAVDVDNNADDFAALQKRAVRALQDATASDKARRSAAAEEKSQLTVDVLRGYRQALELLRSVVGSPQCGATARNKLRDKIGKAAARCEKLEAELAASVPEPPVPEPEPEPEQEPEPQQLQPLHQSFSNASAGAVLTEAEFRQYDEDGSGEICYEEFAQLVRDKGWVYELSDSELQLAWQRIDVSGDGSISHAELTDWWAQGPGERFASLKASDEEKQRLEWAARQFRSYDDDGNETLSPTEFVGLHAQLVEKGLTSLDAKGALAVLDRDGDGEIHISEFIHWLMDAPAPGQRPAQPADEEEEEEEEEGDLELPNLSEEEADTEAAGSGAAAAAAAAVAAAEAAAEEGDPPPQPMSPLLQVPAAAGTAPPSLSSPSGAGDGSNSSRRSTPLASPSLSPAERREAFSASVQAKLAQQQQRSSMMASGSKPSVVPFDLSLYTPRGSNGSISPTMLRLSPATHATAGLDGRSSAVGSSSNRAMVMTPMSATERAAARIRAEAAAVIRTEQADQAAQLEAEAREQRRTRAAEERQAELAALGARTEEERAAEDARRELLLGRSGVLSKLQQGQQERRAARLQGLSVLAASPRGGCRASAQSFDDGMKLVQKAGMPDISLLGTDGGAQRRMLCSQRMSKLSVLARECHVPLDDLDDAMESSDPKIAVVDLILQARSRG